MAPSAIRFASVAAVLTMAAPAHVAATYVLDKTYDASNFLEKFTFNSDPDLTHGFVDYVDEANCDGIVTVSNNKLRLGVDHTTGPNITAPGRKSARLEGVDVFNEGLFIADFAHFPGAACGAWPAFWMYGPNWPHSGEYDIYEVWNMVDYNTVSLHTDGLTDCQLVPDSSVFSGSVLTSNCNTYYQGQGCGTAEVSASSYGGSDSPFQSASGGIYATEWTGDYVKLWSWTHANAPADVLAGKPNPSSWGKPRQFVGGNGCESLPQKMTNQHLVLNIAFCGDGAGINFGECAAKHGYENSVMGCVDYVSQNPEAFADVYFEVNNIRVYQNSSTTPYAVFAESETTTSSSSSATTSSTKTSSSTSHTSTTSSSSTKTSTTSSSTHTSTSSASTSSVKKTSSSSTRTSTKSSTSTSATRHAAPTGTAPVTVNSTIAHATTAVANATSNRQFQNYTLSTLYRTTTSTILSCAPTVTNCPLNHVTTITYAYTTTWCPIGSGHNGTATGTGAFATGTGYATKPSNATTFKTTSAATDTAPGYATVPATLPVAVPSISISSSVAVPSSAEPSVPASTPPVVTAGSATISASFAAIVGAALCALLL